MESPNSPKRRRVTTTELRDRIIELQRQLKPLQSYYSLSVRAAINALPDAARLHYLELQEVSSEHELRDFVHKLFDIVIESAQLLPESYPGAAARVACPLCISGAKGPYPGPGDGWGAVRGLDLHLSRSVEDNGCHVMYTLLDHAKRVFARRMES